LEVWKELLDRGSIDVTDNFFDIGGHSMLVAAATAGISGKIGAKVYVRDIYQHPVLQSLAQVLARRKKDMQGLPQEDAEPVIELQRDIFLSPGTTIRGTFDSSVMKSPRNVLLTGVTGFVGIHLLTELLEKTTANVYCLIRARDEYDAHTRISDAFTRYHINVPASLRERVIPVTGNLTAAELGLSAQQYSALAGIIEIIYHSASSVNFIEPYSYNKSANVDGLREIIKLASSEKLKCLVLLSTISVYSWGHWYTRKQLMTEQDDIRQNILSVSKDIGYVRSKYVMEEIADLAASQGLPVITHRLGYAMCHSVTGACAPYQWWAGLVKTCLQHKAWPALEALSEGLTTVDYMVRSLVHISRKPEAIGRKFNLVPSPSNNILLDQFFLLLQQLYPIKLEALPYKTWRKRWEDDMSSELYPLSSLFRDNMHEGRSTIELYQHTYIWDNSNVKKFLEGSGIEEPVFDRKILDAYLSYLGISL